MTQNQFLEKYKNKEFIVVTVEVNETPQNFVKVDNKILEEHEADIFWILYTDSKTIYADKTTEIVKFE